MKRVRKSIALLGVGCLVVVVLGTLGGPVVAVPPHKHCMETPQGWVEIGPRVFKNPDLHETAFHQFHNHVHVSDVPTTIRAILDPAVPCSSFN
jgi:hypothetical protein